MAGTEKITPSRLTKAQALEELERLEEAGVEFEEEYNEDTKLADLRELVIEGREALADAGDEEDEETDDDEVDLEEEAPKGAGVHVYDRNGEYVRTYTAKDHGKDFKKLAKQFIEKDNRVGYTIKEAK